MSDRPTMPKGDEGMPPGVSVSDIPGESEDKSPAIRRAGLWRRLEEILSDERQEAIQWFMDDVLARLDRMGIKTDDCDGDEAPQVIFSAWIYTQIEHARSSLGGGGLGKGENASPKEATDNDELSHGSAEKKL